MYFFSGVLRLIAQQIISFPFNHIIFTLFSAAGIIWIFQLKKRLLQPEFRRYLNGGVCLMILWMALRTLKYNPFPAGHIITRYAWYLYYLPMLFIPLLLFFSVLSIGKSYPKTISRRWYLLFIPTALILLGILTNDLHQMAFGFPGGLLFWSDSDMNRGIIYYAAMLWIAMLLAASLVVVVVRCAVPERRNRALIPLIPLAAGAVYVLCTIGNVDNLLTRMLKVPEVGCIIFTAFIECLICVHMFPTNDGYGAFWNASSIGAGIMDQNGNICYKSARSFPVTPEQVRQAQTGGVLLADGNLHLKSHAIRGGYGYWLRDISEIKRLNEELEDLGNVTAEENSMLEAENKMKADRIRIEEQNKLYDDMARGVEKQLDILNELLDSLPEEENAFETAMKYACILNAYVKRHSNLLLLSNQNSFIHSEELQLAVIESMEYVQLYGINARSFFDGKGNLPNPAALAVYEMFEEVLEASIPGADQLLVYIKVWERGLTLQMEIHTPGRILPEDCMKEKLEALSGVLEIETEEDTEYVTLTLAERGDRNDVLY